MPCYMVENDPRVYQSGKDVQAVYGVWGSYKLLREGKMREVNCETLEPTEFQQHIEGTESTSQPIVFGFMDILLLLMVAKLMKTPEGLSTLKELGKAFFRMIGDALDSLGKASAANQVTAWANPYLISLVLERFGFIGAKERSDFTLGLAVISGATVAEGFVDTLQGIFPFSRPEKSDFPETIDLGDKTYVLERIPRYREKEE